MIFCYRRHVLATVDEVNEVEQESMSFIGVANEES
jgi:hypothetical protein